MSNPNLIENLDDCYVGVKLKKMILKESLKESFCSCWDFKLVGYCIHLIAGLLYLNKLKLPLAIHNPRKFMIIIRIFTLFIFLFI